MGLGDKAKPVVAPIDDNFSDVKDDDDEDYNELLSIYHWQG